jgi:hypothetical protein
MLDVRCWMLDVFRSPFCFLLSQFLLFPCRLLHSLREGGRNPGPTVRGSKFKVRSSRFGVGCSMLDVGCFFLHSAHPISAFQHFSISAFPPPAPPAGENSRQLAQFAVSRGPTPARSRFQPFSVCPRSPLSAFCFPNFCFPSGRFQPFSFQPFSFSVWPPTTRTVPVPISGLTRSSFIDLKMGSDSLYSSIGASSGSSIYLTLPPMSCTRSLSVFS